MWGAAAEPADSYYQVRPECTDVAKTRFKIKVTLIFLLFYFFVLVIKNMMRDYIIQIHCLFILSGMQLFSFLDYVDHWVH